MSKTVNELRVLLRARADAGRIPGLQRFFKTARGEYAEGDVFIGVKIPQLRTVCANAALYRSGTRSSSLARQCTKSVCWP